MAGAERAEHRRQRVVYTGHVQGVFFRATSAEIAREFAVAGWVRNRPDGTVELEAEGDPEQVEAFLAAVARHFRRNIEQMQSEDRPPRGDESDFRIRY
jgi:acylphosphatase